MRQKESPKAPAKDLYRSPLFVKSRAYLEGRCNQWYVLSAKHGLVDPEAVLEPYEETLYGKSRTDREHWADRVWQELCPKIKAGDRVILLGGRRYREFLEERLRKSGYSVVVPMEGMRIGEQLRWLGNQRREPKLS